VLILGISAFYHESAVCALVDGELVAAVAEERFSRVKHDAALPVEAWRWCLGRVGADVTDIEAVAYYERPAVKLERQRWAGPRKGDAEPGWRDAAAAERAVREGLGWDGPFLEYPHHLSHAASAYYLSGFEAAAVLTADGVGEWATTGYGRGDGDDVKLFAEVRFPHSLGLFYSTLTAYLGFRVNSGEYKVMGLAPYGEPRFFDRLRRVLRVEDGPGFELEMRYFDFVTGRRMWSAELEDLLGVMPRRPGEPLEAVHADLAASGQRLLEEVLLGKAGWLAGEVGSPNLCLAGGVALNGVANGRLLREGPFDRMFVPPAPGDAGGAVGAAMLAHRQLTGRRPATGSPGAPLAAARLGPSWSVGDVAALLGAAGLEHRDHRGDAAALVEETARRLAAGQVVGWFEGAAELGPRALGGRSILADPRDPEVRERLNRRIKRREAFRPFAPAVLAERAGEHFALGRLAPGDDANLLARFMLQTCPVRSPLALPAVTHVDGSARPQTVDPATHPRFAALLAAFERLTGCPVLLNTSFNVAGEPIVDSPADALLTFAAAGLDALVLEDFVIDREGLPADLADLVAVWRSDRRRPWSEGGGRPGAGGAAGDLYTFV
jgi:carbamoyltransferase